MATSRFACRRDARSRRTVALFATFAICTLIFASCTSDSSTNAANTSADAAGATAPPAADALPSEDLTGPFETFPGDTSASGAESVSTSEVPIPKALEVAGRYSFLAQAITASGLTTVLSEPGPFTLFAPTDEAFAKLPTDVVGKLLLPENLKTLQAVLKYHVIGGNLASGSLVDDDPTSLEGSKLHLLEKKGIPSVNGSHIVEADIAALNGTIHGIDFVLLPPTVNLNELTGVAPIGDAGTLVSVHQTLIDDGNFTVLLSALDAAGISSLLEGPGPITMFAPTDEAFDKLPAETLRKLLLPTNKEALTAVLKHHLIASRVNGRDLKDNETVKMLDGTDVTVKIKQSKISVESAVMTFADSEASNGVIHGLDSVLLPPGMNLSTLTG